jgi:hypothetical protein
MRTAAMSIVLLLACSAGAATLELRDRRRIEDKTLVGLSGITYGGASRYYVVADNSDRVYPIGIDLKNDAGIAAVDLKRPWTLAKRGDFEGIALSASHASVFLSDESPAIGEFLLPGMRQMRALPVPEIFKGVAANQGFESLTVSPDGNTLWTANERALVVDGNPQTPATPILSVTRVRLQRYDVRQDRATTPSGQFEYVTGGVHDWGGQVGLCDLAALPDGRLLALERSAAQNFSGVGSIRTRIFLVDTTGAEDISQVASLKDRPPGGVKKTLLFDGFVCGERGMNLEGLCLGPKLADGKWAVVGVVDSTDGPLKLSESAVVTFELDLNAPSTRPATTPAPPTKSL